MAGQPRKYKTPQEMQNAIDDYFLNGMRKKTVIIGKGDNAREVTIELPTICGLCLFMGFADRASFYDYEKLPEYTHTIKRARTFIEKEYEELLREGNPAGAIFALKNFGWRDKQELDLNGEMRITGLADIIRKSVE